MLENFDLKKYKKVHFIGIGGIGVSAVARMMLHEDKKVTGSDRSDSEIIDALRRSGAKVKIGQSAENIEEGTDLVVYTVAITDDNTELVRAREISATVLT